MYFRLLLLTLSPAVVGVLAGFVAGGRLSGFRTLRIRAVWMIPAAAILQFAHLRFGLPVLPVVFLLVLGWFAVNIVRWPRIVRAAGAVIVLGALMNAVVIGLNGHMPYSSSASRAAGLTPGVSTPENAPAGAGTRLVALGDVLAAPHVVFSLGDVVIAGGVVLFVAGAMRRGRRVETVPVRSSRPLALHRRRAI